MILNVHFIGMTSEHDRNKKPMSEFRRCRSIETGHVFWDVLWR